MTGSVSDKEKKRASTFVGKDEMNLAEFPFATLGRRDSRKELRCQGSVIGPDGQRHHFEWIAEAGATQGLPTEFGERVFIALIAVTAKQDFQSRKVEFSVYQVLQILGLTFGRNNYLLVKRALRQLKGLTIYSERAFLEHASKERLVISEGFNLIDTYRLRYRETSTHAREDQSAPAYIIWGELIWQSFQTGYIKHLDLDFFYSLESAVSRRLYRFLDKQMKHDKEKYPGKLEIDIFELSSRLGMARYPKPSLVKQKLQPGFDELIARGFLANVEVYKRKAKNGKQYTRVRFTKPDGIQPPVDEQRPEVVALIKRGLTQTKAQNLIKNLPSDFEHRLEYFDWKVASDQPPNDPPGWLVWLLETEEYRTPSTFKTRAQHEEEVAAQNRIQEAVSARKQHEKQQADDQLQKQKNARQNRLDELREQYQTSKNDEVLWRKIKGQIDSRIRGATHLNDPFDESILLGITGDQAYIALVDGEAQNLIEKKYKLLVRQLFKNFIKQDIEPQFISLENDNTAISQ